MLRFTFRRLLQIIPVLWIIITATFFMIRFVPGGPFTAEKAVTPEILRNLEAHYGLDKPLYRQYLDYMGSLLRGDFGPSSQYPNRTVNEIIGDKLPTSLELGFISLAVALAIGITLGTLAAVKRNSWLDYMCSSVAMVGICVPTFVLGPLLVLTFAIHFQWLNASGWYGPSDRILPCLTLGCVYAAYIARLTRGGMLRCSTRSYIRTARAKGAGEFGIVFKHALRGGLLPVISFLGPAHRRNPNGVLCDRDHFPNPRSRPRICEQRLQPRLHLGPRHGHSLRDPDCRPQSRGRHRPDLAQPETRIRMSPATLPSATVTPEQIETGNSLWHDAWSRLRKNKLAVFGGVTLLVLSLLCAFGPLFAQSYQDQNLDLGASAPSTAHWLGTDTLGRDLFPAFSSAVASRSWSASSPLSSPSPSA